jgi:uncharacterized integral membrane protein
MSTPVPRRNRAVARAKDTTRLLAVAVLAAVVTLLAVLNLDEVEVRLLVGSPRMPLIVVIAACVLVGVLIGALLGRRSAR